MRRPISPNAPLVGRQLWRVGDWGGASEQIGRRWEELGAAELLGLLGTPRPGPGGQVYTPLGSVIISAEPELATAVHRSGRAHADAILVGRAGDQAVLEPVDFKWNLETAEPRQVGKEVLETLLGHALPLLAERVAEALHAAGFASDTSPLLHAGIFLAPDYPPNRACLPPLGTLPEEMAVLRPVDPLGFFSSLPGWEVALALAQSDHARLDRLEAVERYFRLGAGTLGALRRLATSIFEEQLALVDGVGELEQLRARRGLRTAGQLIAYLDRAQAARGDLVERLREVEGRVYPFGAFRRELAKRGIVQEDARKLGRLHGQLLQPVRGEMRAAGRELLNQGLSERQALEALEAQTPRFTQLAVRALDRALSVDAPASSP